jgi:serine/threonine protein kinase
MSQQNLQSVVMDDTALSVVAVELGLLTPAQVELVRARQAELRQGGVVLTFSQVLLERKLINLEQLKKLMQEMDSRLQITSAATKLKTAAEQLNTQFGSFILKEIIIDNARVRVFKAKDTVNNRFVTLKVLPPNITKDAVWYERFKREVVLTKVLDHPNIITTYGAGEIEGCPVTISEFVDGLTLSERLAREGNFPEKTAWLMGREIAKALAYAAQIGIIHRDIKPDNIVCSATGEVKIVDMGLSKALGDDTGLTAPGTTVGTPFYISPEQARGVKDIDGRTDIYSLGCTIYHMLTGNVPFMGEVLTDVMLAHTKAPRPDPRSILPEISAASTKLVTRMMAIKPDDRPNDAAELVADMDALLQALPDPIAEFRPVQMVAPSRVTVSIPKSDSTRPRPKPAEVVEKPRLSIFTRFTDWLSSLFN